MQLTLSVLAVLFVLLFITELTRHTFFYLKGWKRVRAYLHGDETGFHVGWAKGLPDGTYHIIFWLHGEWEGQNHLIQGYSPYREWLFESEVKRCCAKFPVPFLPGK